MNNKKIEFLELAEMILESSLQPLSARDIWKKAKQLRYTDQLDSEGKTPLATLAAMLYRDIRDKKENSIFYKLGEKPAKYQLKKCAKQDNVEYVKKNLSKINNRRLPFYQIGPIHRFGHYIFIVNENPDNKSPNMILVKVGGGDISARFRSCRTYYPEVYVYRSYLHSKDIEDNIQELFAKYGTRIGNRKQEIYKIDITELKKLTEDSLDGIFDEILEQNKIKK